MMLKRLNILLLGLFLVACSGTYTINQHGLSVSWPQLPATPTPGQGSATPTLDVTPTPESNVTVIPGTPVVFPTTEPLPALLPLSDNLRVRTCPGLGCQILGEITRIDCLEFDHRAYQIANGIVWVQPQGSNFGQGIWVAFKNVGANGTPYARAFSDFRCINEVTVPLP